MKKLILMLWLALASLSCFAQNGNNYAKGFAYIGTLAGIPATCSVGQIAFISDATAGQNIYECSATNTWTQQLNSGGGAGTVTHTAGALTAGQIATGNGAADITVGDLSGDVTTSGATVTTVVKANGNTFPSGIALGDVLYGSAANAISKLAGATTLNGVPQFYQSQASGGVATAPTLAPAGVTTNAQTGTTYTVAATDRTTYVSFSNAGSIAVTLPQAGSTGFANNFAFVACDIGAGTATITPTTSNISYTSGSAYTAAAASIALTTGQCAWIYSDNSNYFAIQRTGGSVTSVGASFTGGLVSVGGTPVTSSGTLAFTVAGTSGGIPYFSGATTWASSGALTSNVLIKGGGAGASPAVSLLTDDGTTATYTGTGGYSAPSITLTGANAGYYRMTQGTAQGHAAANTVTIEAPAAVTAYEIVEPGASASGFTYGTNSAAVRTESFGELSGDVTTSGSLATTVAKVNGIGIQRVTMVADWTCGTSSISTSCTAATIVGTNGTPLTITLPSVAAAYHLHCEGVVGQATAATSNQWNLLTATNGATNVTASYKMATAATASAYGAVTDQASTTTTFQIAPNWTLGGTATKMPFSIDASIEGASASGTVVSLQLLAPTAADVVTIYRGAFCSVAPF